MIGVIDPARKCEVVDRATSTFKSREHASAGGFQEFKLNGSAGFLLDDYRA